MLFWFVIVLFGLLIVLEWNAFFVFQHQNDFEFQELERNSSMMIDSLLKNRDTVNPQYGAAQLSPRKHRVQSNQLDRSLLEKIPFTQAIDNQPVFFQKIELVFSTHSETIFETEARGNCLSLERLGIIENQKTIVRGVICRV
ncbi:hypothetical protein KKE06_03525 [Candidatus Micrarchaeota archaeon]|nr:hypothetical protein [Candidatus Micrarchaeota archaeon]MBU1930962.1 hypothetical protein [Candidatus Micrarchaeota archaeon]